MELHAYERHPEQDEKYALQHLEAYEQVYKKLPPIISKKFFPAEKLSTLRKTQPALKLYFQIEAVIHPIIQNVVHMLQSKGFFLDPGGEATIDSFVPQLLFSSIYATKFPEIFNPAKEGLSPVIYVQQQASEEFYVMCGHESLGFYSVTKEGSDYDYTQQAASFVCDALKSVIYESVSQIKHTTLSSLRLKYRRLQQLHVEFFEDFELTVLKIQDSNSLKGRCAICRRP